MTAADVFVPVAWVAAKGPWSYSPARVHATLLPWVRKALEMISSKPQYRQAEIADAPGIAELLRASIIELCTADHGNREEPLRAWLANKTSANVETWIRNPLNIMLVAEVRGQLAGVGCLRTDGHLILNYVSPSCRFQGVSRTVLEALEERGRESGLQSLSLESTRTALRFYQAAGYASAGLPEIKHGLPAYPMSKSLV